MSTKNYREDWRWYSLFDPETGIGLPPIEGGFEEDYEVEEDYMEIDIEDEETDDDDFNNDREEIEEIPVFADEDEDE